MHLQQGIKYWAKFIKSIAAPFYIKGRKNFLHIAQNKQYKALNEESYKYQRSACNNSVKKITAKQGIAQLLKSRSALFCAQY